MLSCLLAEVYAILAKKTEKTEKLPKVVGLTPSLSVICNFIYVSESLIWSQFSGKISRKHIGNKLTMTKQRRTIFLHRLKNLQLILRGFPKLYVVGMHYSRICIDIQNADQKADVHILIHLKEDFLNINLYPYCFLYNESKGLAIWIFLQENMF